MRIVLAKLSRGFTLHNISHLFFLDIGMEHWFNLKLNETGLNYEVNMAHNLSHWIVCWLQKGSRTFTRAVVSKFDFSIHLKAVDVTSNLSRQVIL